MKKLALLLILMLGFGTANAQTNGLNGFDATNKKHGRWLLYLDANGAKVDDSTKAVYKRYTWYDSGAHTLPMGWFFTKGGKIETTGAQAEKGKIVLLSGEYKTYNKDGKLTSIHKFDNGNYVSFTEYYPSGSILSFFDFTKHCDGQEHSWHFSSYDATGKVEADECVKKGADGKWPKMRG